MPRDILFALRQLLKNPGFTAVAVLTLAIGVGVNTSMFTTLETLLSRPLPYPNSESLVQLFLISARSKLQSHHSFASFVDYHQNGDFESISAYTDKRLNLAEPGAAAERIPGLLVTSDFFRVLQTQPQLGRVFTAEEDQPGVGNAVVVLNHWFWQQRFAGDPNIIGRQLRLDGESTTVVGVMPAWFQDTMFAGAVAVYRPLALTEDQRQNRGHHFLKCIARIKPGLTIEQAQAATDVLAARQLQENPGNSPPGLRVIPLARAKVPPEGRIILWSIMALAGFVLLIACANLANLQVARTAARGREFAVRSALGAGQVQLLRPLLAESLLLALTGGLLGLILAHWSNQILQRQFLIDGQAALDLRFNWRVFTFALAASSISGLVAGFLPAIIASRVDANDALKQGGRGATADRSHHRLQHTLIISEVALAFILLASAGLLVHGLRGFAILNPGWRLDGMTMGSFTLPEKTYENGERIRAFVDQLETRLRGVPGVQNVAVCWNVPIRQFNVSSSFEIDGQPLAQGQSSQTCFVNGVSPEYFKTMGMSLLAGRNFTAADRTNGAPVVIINEAMSRAFWPNGSPLGHQLNGAEIVGVVNDVRFPANPAEWPTSFQTYRPFAQEPREWLSVVVRGELSGDVLRRVVSEIDSDLPVGDPGPVRAQVGRSLDNWRVGGRLLTVFALLGVALATLGVYGVVSRFVVRRTAEFGIRMALGAQIRDILYMVVGKGLWLSLFGTIIGLIGAFGVMRLLNRLLPELPGGGFMVLLTVAAILGAIMVLACWLPARRAARVDPMTALRAE